MGNGSFSLKDSAHFEKHKTIESPKRLFPFFITPWSSKYEARKIKSRDGRKASLPNATFSLYTIEPAKKKRVKEEKMKLEPRTHLRNQPVVLAK